MEFINKSFSSNGGFGEEEYLEESPSKISRNSLIMRNSKDASEMNNSFTINDDENEKRNRRKKALDMKKSKSKKVVMGPISSKRTINEVDLDEDAPLPVITTLSLEEINKRYEEWMKFAADNKINSTNTWNFELIDYFSKINFFRDGNSINFQKASCTLDGCVKVYTSRVDSVVSETGILLNGLAESSAKRTQQLEEEFNGENGKEKEKEKRKNVRSEQTLVKDFSAINIKQFDLEFSVDPLFKKTCADFDEGGARGLLLNHLTTQGDGRLIFDAGDSSINQDEKESIESEQSKTLIDLSELFDDSFEASNLEAKDICPSLKNFNFGANTALQLPNFEDYSDISNENYEELEEHNSFFNGPDDPFLDITMGTFAKQNGVLDNLDDNPEGEDQLDKENSMIAEEHDKNGQIELLAESDNIFSYFDDKLMKNWAGPEHWKLKRFAKAPPVDSSAQGKKSKPDKSVAEIDFLTFNNQVDPEKLFKPAETGITSRKNTDKIADSYLLPEDLQYGSRNFLTLFSKPTFTIKPLKHPSKLVEGRSFIVKQETEDFPGLPADKILNSVEPIDYASEVPVEHIFPNTYEDIDDNGDDLPPTLIEEVGFDKELNMNYNDQDFPELKRVQTLKINFMKTAKRVDIKLLKENLWKIINKDDPGASANILDGLMEDGKTSTSKDSNDAQEILSFRRLVSEIPSAYPKKKAKDLSVPFCFICLLHLANEHNLEIEDNLTMNELLIKKEN